MPVIPPDTPDTSQQSDIRERLVQALTDHVLNYKQPPVPQYQPAAYPPGAGIAMYRNPQLAGVLNNAIQAPAQANYMNQQAAFEAAMQGHKENLAALTSLTNAEARQSRYMRPQLRLVNTTDAKGNPITKPMLFDPETETLSPIETTEGEGQFGRFVQPATVPYVDPDTGQATLGRVDKVAGTVRPVTSGGKPVGAIPPAGIVNAAASDISTLQGMDTLEGAYKKIREHVQSQNFPTQAIGTWVGETRYGGKLAPAYAEYTSARRASLNAYIKAQTGAQFSVKELERYEGQYPEPWDDETLAAQKIANLKQRALTDMRTKQRLYPSLGNQSMPAAEDPKAAFKRRWGVQQ